MLRKQQAFVIMNIIYNQFLLFSFTVVFNLHETFPKPKRVIKEPPYVVKESGYAGFDIPIHIYFKNKNEPKRFEIMYNLNLDLSVPSVNHIIHHSEIIMNPSDEFRRKLLKGGAVSINFLYFIIY